MKEYKLICIENERVIEEISFTEEIYKLMKDFSKTDIVKHSLNRKYGKYVDRTPENMKYDGGKTEVFKLNINKNEISTDKPICGICGSIMEFENDRYVCNAFLCNQNR